jgi:hypothetical protein
MTLAPGNAVATRGCRARRAISALTCLSSRARGRKISGFAFSGDPPVQAYYRQSECQDNELCGCGSEIRRYILEQYTDFAEKVMAKFEANPLLRLVPALTFGFCWPCSYPIERLIPRPDQLMSLVPSHQVLSNQGYFGRTLASPPGLPGGGITRVLPVPGVGARISGSTPAGGHKTPSVLANLSPSGSVRSPLFVPSGTTVPRCGADCDGVQSTGRGGAGGAAGGACLTRSSSHMRERQMFSSTSWETIRTREGSQKGEPV